MKSSFLPKCEWKIVMISALTTHGRNPDIFFFVFWEKWWLHQFILKLTDLWFNESILYNFNAENISMQFLKLESAEVLYSQSRIAETSVTLCSSKTRCGRYFSAEMQTKITKLASFYYLQSTFRFSQCFWGSLKRKGRKSLGIIKAQSNFIFD